jgi:hypothetical protein
VQRQLAFVASPDKIRSGELLPLSTLESPLRTDGVEFAALCAVVLQWLKPQQDEQMRIIIMHMKNGLESLFTASLCAQKVFCIYSCEPRKVHAIILERSFVKTKLLLILTRESLGGKRNLLCGGKKCASPRCSGKVFWRDSTIDFLLF